MRRIDEAHKYRYLDHAADIKIKSNGQSLDQAYEHMGIAVANMITDTSELAGLVRKKLIVESKSITSLLYEYLNNILTLVEEEHFLIKHIYYLSITQLDEGFKLTCELHGDSDPAFAKTKKPKKVTYTDMSLELMEATNSYEVTIVLEL